MDKSFHNKYGLLNNRIGLLQTWGWKNQHIFLDFENNVVVPDVDPSTIELLDETQRKKIMEERNYRQPKENETFNDRQKMYGKIHDNILRLHNEEGIDVGGEYSLDYCRGVAHMFAMEAYHSEMINTYGKDYGTDLITNIKDLSKELQEAVRKIALKHLIGSMENPSTYDTYCNKMGIGADSIVGEYVPESDVVSLMHRLKNLGEFGKSVLTSPIMECQEIQFLLKQC